MTAKTTCEGEQNMSAVRSLFAGEGGRMLFSPSALVGKSRVRPRIFFSGIADEAGLPVDVQIRAHKDLGWRYIDLRLVPDNDGGKKNICLVQQESFEKAAAAVRSAGLAVACLESSIANWNKPVNGDFELDKAELRSALERCRVLHTDAVRIMSWQRVAGIDETTTRNIVLERMKVLVGMAESTSVDLLIENCAGWAGENPANLEWLITKIGSPRLAAIYDTGNPVQYLQDPWRLYVGTKPWIRYVHIKDAKGTGERDKEVYTYPGEGDGRVKDVVRDLIESGYTGGFCIEPHLAAVIHKGTTSADPAQLYNTYTEYGRRFMALVNRIRPLTPEKGEE